MSRAPDEARRRELLQQSLGYFAEHGIATTSLRPLAAALGTSDRMLLHYFGSKDALIGQVLAATRPDVQRLIDAAAQDVSELARELWRELTAQGGQSPRVRLLLQVMVLATTHGEPYRSYAQEASRRWVDTVAAALRADTNMSRIDSTATATALVSGLRGLALDRFATGDRVRTDRAAEALLSALIPGREPTKR